MRTGYTVDLAQLGNLSNFLCITVIFKRPLGVLVIILQRLVELILSFNDAFYPLILPLCASLRSVVVFVQMAWLHNPALT